MLAASSSVMLLGPGVVYLIEAYYLKRGQAWAATLGLRTAAAHVASIVIVFGLSFTGLFRVIGRAATVPAVVNAFFVPAIGAFAVHTLQARRATAAIGAVGRAFEAICVAEPASPIAAPVFPASAGEPKLRRPDDRT